jgi:hypothetical protein
MPSETTVTTTEFEYSDAGLPTKTTETVVITWEKEEREDEQGWEALLQAILREAEEDEEDEDDDEDDNITSIFTKMGSGPHRPGCRCGRTS